MVYYVASVVVLYSAEAHTQRHYRGHTEDIESMCVHPQVNSTSPTIQNSGSQEALCATGQAATPGDEDSAHVQVFSSHPSLSFLLLSNKFNTVVRCGIMKLWSWCTSLALGISPTG